VGAALPRSVAAQQAASPDPSVEAAATDLARVLFEEGTDKAHRGDWSEALRAFERSDALRPHAVTRYNIGYCERALGRVTRARRMLTRALAADDPHGARELPEDLAIAAQQYLVELEARVARATIAVAPEGTAILVDGRPLEPTGAASWAGTREPGPAEATPASPFEVELDPGAHVFVVSKDGYGNAVTTRTFEPGTNAKLVIELAAPRPADAPAPLAVRDEATRLRAPSRVPVYVALGVAGAGALAGGIGGTVAWIQKAKVADSCEPHVPCTGAGSTYLTRADLAADVSTTGFVVAGVGAVTAAALWWFSLRRDAAPATGDVRIAPWIAPTGAGLRGTF
jgi:hypothetical protein